MVELDHNELVVVSGMDCVVVVPKMGLELGELDHNEVVVHELVEVEVEVAENSQGSGMVVVMAVVVEVMPRQGYMALVRVVVEEEVV